MNIEEQPATKKDIAGLGADIGALDAKLDTSVNRLDAKIDRVAVELVRTQADVREIKETMATKGHMERLMRSFDDFAARAVHYDRADASRGFPRKPPNAGSPPAGRSLDRDVLEKHGGVVAVAGVREDDHDQLARVLRPCRQPQRCRHGRAAGDAHRYPLLLVEPPSQLHGLLIGHGLYLVDQG